MVAMVPNLPVWAESTGIILAAIFALVPVLNQMVKRIEKGRDDALSEFMTSSEHAERLTTFEEILEELSTKFQTHMDNEEVALALVTDLGEELKEADKAAHGKLNCMIETVMKKQGDILDSQIEVALNIVKSMGITDPNPVLIYKTVPGSYAAQWVNEAWTEWTGLDLEDTRSGGDMLAVQDDERGVVGPSVTETGQMKEAVDVKYTMVQPYNHDKVVGRVWAHGYPIHTQDPNAWYYVTRIRKIEDDK